MSDRERTITAAIVASVSVLLSVAGFFVSARVAVVGFALLALGGLGAIEAVLIGLGLMRIGDDRDERRGR